MKTNVKEEVPKPKKKVLFYKTVRANGDSLWAIGRFKRNYVVGNHYTFPVENPAFGFIGGTHIEQRSCLLDDACIDGETLPWKVFDCDSEVVYRNRAESVGCRVLICYGVLEKRIVGTYLVGESWDLNNPPFSNGQHWTSTDFVVIGEVKVANPDIVDAPSPFTEMLPRLQVIEKTNK